MLPSANSTFRQSISPPRFPVPTIDSSSLPGASPLPATVYLRPSMVVVSFFLFSSFFTHAMHLPRQERNYIVVLLIGSLGMLAIPIYHEYNLPVW